MSTAGGRLFAIYLKDVTSRVEVYGLDGALLDRVELPAPGDAERLRRRARRPRRLLLFTSMDQPPTIYPLRHRAATSTLFRAPEIAGFDPRRYESRQVFFKSSDGTRVPMFLVHKQGIEARRPQPDPPLRLRRLQRHAAPRLQRARASPGSSRAASSRWPTCAAAASTARHGTRPACALKKQNVFDDCIAAAEYLIAERYTSPDRLAAAGRQQRRPARRRRDQPAARPLRRRAAGRSA